MIHVTPFFCFFFLFLFCSHPGAILDAAGYGYKDVVKVRTIPSIRESMEVKYTLSR